mmetsp:Transcript_2289/g.4339  ORF Transcript_2289/g.4339 Transcript_2289/m.4339 type:complete len:218 (+) Transcript_2289:541-1194(+)
MSAFVSNVFPVDVTGEFSTKVALPTKAKLFISLKGGARSPGSSATCGFMDGYTITPILLSSDSSNGQEWFCFSCPHNLHRYFFRRAGDEKTVRPEGVLFFNGPSSSSNVYVTSQDSLLPFSKYCCFCFSSYFFRLRLFCFSSDSAESLIGSFFRKIDECCTRVGGVLRFIEPPKAHMAVSTRRLPIASSPDVGPTGFASERRLLSLIFPKVLILILH